MWEMDFNNNMLMYLVYALFIHYSDFCCLQCWASYFQNVTFGSRHKLQELVIDNVQVAEWEESQRKKKRKEGQVKG